MDVRLARLAQRQDDLVAAWQLVAAGWSRRRVAHHARRDRWRRIHSGVYALTQAPLTRRQGWIAATLTAPATVLSHASAGACLELRPWEGSFETVTRPGSGGPRRVGSVLVCRSQQLAGETTSHKGIPTTSAERTLIDLAPELDRRSLGRALREALRLRLTTASRMQEAIDRHPARRGTAALRKLATRYADIPYAATRSDAEARAVELLHDAGLPAPRVNRRIAGEEADLSWADRRVIIEIDGPDFHRFSDQDARKQRAWEEAGWAVHRLSSGVVYDAPARLVSLVRGSVAA